MENRTSAKYKINLYGFLLFSTLLLLTVGAGVQSLLEFLDSRKYDPPGELIRMDGYRLHLYCSGSGDFTVLLETDLTLPYIEWQLVQNKISDLTQVCSYDRAGLGWSEPSIVPRESQEMAEELYRLLQKANITNQLLVVGDGNGTLLARMFAHQYPEKVSGVILIDPYRGRYSSVFQRKITNPSQNNPFYRLSTFATWLGITRLSASLGWLNHIIEPIDGLPQSFQHEYLYLTAYRTKHWAAAAGELIALENLLADVSTNNDLGDVPLIIYANQSTLEGEPNFRTNQTNQVDLVNNLKTISTRSNLEVCTDCGIIPPLANPDAVAGVIEAMLGQLKP